VRLTALDVAPLAKVPTDDGVRLVPGCLLADLADVERPVLTRERAGSAHVVLVVGMLLAPKDVGRAVREDCRRRRDPVEVIALDAAGRSGWRDRAGRQQRGDALAAEGSQEKTRTPSDSSP
jgi:hypothetical protein